MRLRDRVANRKYKTAVTNESIAKQAESLKAKRYSLFLKIVNKLIENLDDYDNVCYCTSQEVFDEIEKRKIDISDIVSDSNYDLFKQQILCDNVSCPHIGGALKSEQKITNEDYVEYLRKHPDMRF